MDALPSCGLHERREDAEGFYSVVRSCPEADLPEDHHLSQGLFCVIVRGWNAGDTQEGEEMYLFRAHEECPQGLGWFERERPLTDSLQLGDETLFDVRRILPGDLA